MERKSLLLFICAVLTTVMFVAHGAPDQPYDAPKIVNIYEGYCHSPQWIPPPPHDLRLIQVTTFIRHGDRVRAGRKPCWRNDTTRFQCAPNTLTQLDADSAKFQLKTISSANLHAGNCLRGVLTSRGRQQSSRNGQAARDAYILAAKLLPADLFNASNMVEFHSTMYSRTLQSGQEFVSGMFNVTADTSLPYPIDWFTMDPEIDPILPTRFCPALNQEIANATSSPAFRMHHTKVVEPLQQELWKRGILHVSSASAISVHDLMDCIQVQRCHGYPLPPGLDKELADAVVQASMWKRGYEFLFGDVAKLGIGSLVAELWRHFRSTIFNSTASGSAEGTMPSTNAAAPRFVLYAGHDMGPIMPLLAAFEIYDGHWSPYASMINIELYEVPVLDANTDSATTIAKPASSLVRGEDGATVPSAGDELSARSLTAEGGDTIGEGGERDDDDRDGTTQGGFLPGEENEDGVEASRHKDDEAGSHLPHPRGQSERFRRSYGEVATEPAEVSQAVLDLLHVSCAEFQLFRGYAVRFVYNGDVMSPPGCVGGGGVCSLTRFARQVAKILEVGKECARDRLEIV